MKYKDPIMEGTVYQKYVQAQLGWFSKPDYDHSLVLAESRVLVFLGSERQDEYIGLYKYALMNIIKQRCNDATVH